MAIVRITTTPGTKQDKPNRYLAYDIKNTNTKYLRYIKIISVICAISIICNIVQLLTS